MKVAVDTNVLLRATLRDDQRQGDLAVALMREADLIAISSASLCEYVWVLERTYRLARTDIVASLETLLRTNKIVVDRPAIEAGLAAYCSGCDFADGVIAHEGRWLGAQTFVSFDKRAIASIAKLGIPVRLFA